MNTEKIWSKIWNSNPPKSVGRDGLADWALSNCIISRKEYIAIKHAQKSWQNKRGFGKYHKRIANKAERRLSKGRTRERAFISKMSQVKMKGR